jgi:hypothetical protein
MYLRFRVPHHGPAPAEVTTDKAGPYLRVLDELVPAAAHVTERYGNNRVEADHGRLKARLRPTRGLKRFRSAARIVAGHAFVQNLRRGHLAAWEWRSAAAGRWLARRPCRRRHALRREAGEPPRGERWRLSLIGFGVAEIADDSRPAREAGSSARLPTSRRNSSVASHRRPRRSLVAGRNPFTGVEGQPPFSGVHTGTVTTPAVTLPGARQRSRLVRDTHHPAQR